MMERDKFIGLLRRAAKARMRAQYAVDVQLILPVEVDEVSLLFATTEELEAFTERAKHDWRTSHFASVESDKMMMIKIGSEDQGVLPSFHVRFEFLRLEGATWRIEAMAKLDGSAPLHERALADHGSGCVVHASYRAGTTMEQYTNELSKLKEYGELEALYANTYGQFSYWNVGELGHVYLKPRVNLRDQN